MANIIIFATKEDQIMVFMADRPTVAADCVYPRARVCDHSLPYINIEMISRAHNVQRIKLWFLLLVMAWTVWGFDSN